MQFSISFSFPFAMAMLFLTAYPVASAYYVALRQANLSEDQTTLLGVLATITALFGIYCCGKFVSQTQTVCFGDMLLLVMTFLVQKKIIRKGPAFFFRHFFQPKKVGTEI